MAAVGPRIDVHVPRTNSFPVIPFIKIDYTNAEHQAICVNILRFDQ